MHVKPKQPVVITDLKKVQLLNCNGVRNEVLERKKRDEIHKSYAKHENKDRQMVAMEPNLVDRLVKNIMKRSSNNSPGVEQE